MEIKKSSDKDCGNEEEGGVEILQEDSIVDEREGTEVVGAEKP